MLRVLAIDLGATSARVVAVDLDASPPSAEVVYRYRHQPVRLSDGSLRWDWPRLVDAVVEGAERAMARGSVASIGVDAWGVDYGLLDDDGRLLSLPHSYRDQRTAGWKQVAERLGLDRLFQVSGIQPAAINTIFQLAVHDPTELEAAKGMLLLPELLVHGLTGVETGERTSAGTTGLVAAATGEWSEELIDAIELDSRLLPSIDTAPRRVGTWRSVPVHLVGGHDTASAIVALTGQPAPRAAFISSGTWMLVGAERPSPDTSDAAQQGGFSNEPAALGGTLMLKNLMGLWLLDRCIEAWNARREDVLALAAGIRSGPVVDPGDERFLRASDVDAEVRTVAGLARSGREQVARCILDSLAAAAAKVVAQLGGFLGGAVSEVHLVGGGSRNLLLNQLIAQAVGVPVRMGSPEATALGNALVQGIALGRFADLGEARDALAAAR